MLHDEDDVVPVARLADVLAEGSVSANVVIADEDGRSGQPKATERRQCRGAGADNHSSSTKAMPHSRLDCIF
jgi:hypothetical protein